MKYPPLKAFVTGGWLLAFFAATFGTGEPLGLALALGRFLLDFAFEALAI